jgi:hypothetical protein
MKKQKSYMSQASLAATELASTQTMPLANVPLAPAHSI